jgi:hypothetical protein
MNVPVLVIKLHGRRIGCLFKYAQPGLPPILTRSTVSDVQVSQSK